MQPATTIALQLALVICVGHAKQSGRINHGEKVPIEHYPYMVNIWNGDKYIATGTIISPNCILTGRRELRDVYVNDLRVYGAVSESAPARCCKVFEGRANEVLVPDNSSVIRNIYWRSSRRLERQNYDDDDDDDSSSSSSTNTTTTTTTTTEEPSREGPLPTEGPPPSSQPSADCCAPELDIAIIVLQPQRNEVRTIRIDQTPVQTGDYITIAGWGHSDALEEPSVELTAMYSTVTPDFRCRFFWSAKHLPDTHFCVEENWLGERPNRNDAGGPAIRNGKQVGVLSAVNTCATSPVPSVFTSLSSTQAKAFLSKAFDYYC